MISKADLIKNKNDIIRLWKKNFQGVPKSRYEWIYENNPAGVPSCWIAEKDGEVVGSTALFPRRLFINGKPVIAGIAGDFSVNKEVRGFGPALALQREALSNYWKDGFSLLYSLPNKQSEGALRRSGYSVIGDIISLTKPLRSQYFLMKNLPFTIARIVSKPVDMAIKVFAIENFHIGLQEHSVEVVTSFDSRFDKLWERMMPNFSIIGERSSSYLNWRFAQSPHNKYSVFIIKQAKTDDIHGYIVFSTTDNRISIADILYYGDGTVDSLLSKFLLLLRRNKIDSVSISLAGCDDLLNKLMRFGFSMRGREGKLLALFSPDSPYSQRIAEIKNWYLLAGDNDI